MTNLKNLALTCQGVQTIQCNIAPLNERLNTQTRHNSCQTPQQLLNFFCGTRSMLLLLTSLGESCAVTSQLRELLLQQESWSSASLLLFDCKVNNVSWWNYAPYLLILLKYLVNIYYDHIPVNELSLSDGQEILLP